MTYASLEAPLIAAAEAFGAREAFRFRGEGLSYADLHRQSRAMAQCLVRNGVQKGDRVAIAMTKGLEMPVAIFGIWMAGAAFVPLDPSAPIDRLTWIIEDCAINVVVSADRNRKLADALATRAAITVIGTDADVAPLQESGDFETVENHAEDLAYIIFTSGSTGTPKGICHTHASGLAFANAWIAQYDLRRDDVFFSTVPLHFDFSLADFFAPAMRGAVTELVPEQILLFPASLAEMLEKSGGTIWSSVPYTFVQLCERGAVDARDLSCLRWLIYGGEPMPPSSLPLLRRTFSARISNSYGPAEVNQVSEYTVPNNHPEDHAVPIGETMPHAKFLRAEDGELLVAAPSMMRGYWNRPDLDTAAFLDLKGLRYYRTGDRVEIDQNGLWVFMGREDRQIKLRGYRIELDEVEMALASHPDVSEAAAIVSADKLGIVGFATLVAGAQTDARDLMAHLSEKLPRYAVPDRIDIRQTFVKTSTGKINRRALLEEAT